MGNKETLGAARPQTCARVLRTLDPQLANEHSWNKVDKLRLPRWGYDKFEGFWPKKAWEHPRGKVNFPLRMIPWLSPDALHPGWRPKDAGPEAQ